MTSAPDGGACGAAHDAAATIVLFLKLYASNVRKRRWIFHRPTLQLTNVKFNGYFEPTALI